jgi:hypothetical protein
MSADHAGLEVEEQRAGNAARPRQRVLPRGLGRQVRSPRGVFDLEPGVISVVAFSRRSASYMARETF